MLCSIGSPFQGDVFAQRGKKNKSNKRSASAAAASKRGSNYKRSASSGKAIVGTINTEEVITPLESSVSVSESGNCFANWGQKGGRWLDKIKGASFEDKCFG